MNTITGILTTFAVLFVGLVIYGSQFIETTPTYTNKKNRESSDCVIFRWETIDDCTKVVPNARVRTLEECKEIFYFNHPNCKKYEKESLQE